MVAALAAAATLAGARPAASESATPSQPKPSTCSRWKVVPAPDVHNYALSGVAGTSSTDVWAVGYNAILPAPGLILHWDGSTWTQVPEPIDGVSLYDVTAVSPTDAWAVGRIYDVPPLILHWDGATWQQSATPIPGTYIDLYGVSAVSSTDVWAVGTYTDQQGFGRSLNMHWDGTAWSVIHAPLGVLYGVSALSADDVWAVGYSSPAPFTAQPLIEHWDGVKWTVVPAAPPPFGDQNELEGVAAVSPDDVWAVGFYGFAAKPLRPLAEHWEIGR